MRQETVLQSSGSVRCGDVKPLYGSHPSGPSRKIDGGAIPGCLPQVRNRVNQNRSGQTLIFPDPVSGKSGRVGAELDDFRVCISTDGFLQDKGAVVKHLDLGDWGVSGLVETLRHGNRL